MNRIKALRQEHGLRQSDLASLLNTKPQTVSHYEKGDRGLDVETIFRLCDIFGCTADYLLGRSESPSPAVSDADAALLSAFHAAPPHVIRAIDTLLEPYKKAAETDRAG